MKEKIAEAVLSSLYYYTVYGDIDGRHAAFVQKHGYRLVADMVGKILTDISRPEIYFEFDKMRTDYTLKDIAHHHSMWEQEQFNER